MTTFVAIFVFMNQPQHLINWLQKQTHIKPSAICEASEINKSVLSRLLNNLRKPNKQHYDALLPFCKKIGYKPIKKSN